MADTERKRLLSQQPRGTPGSSGCAAAFFIVFGLPFMAAGGAIGLLASGVIPPAAVKGTPMPSGLTWCLALLFFGAGVFLSALGIRGLVERSRLHARRARYPREPWRVDYPWDATGISHNPGSSLPGQIGAAAFMLRCIEERTETRRSGTRTSIRTVCDQLWADEVAQQGGAVRDGNEVTVRFDLPEGDYGTRLAEPPARYWELAVVADTPGVDFSAKFLVPVYARS